MLLCTVTYNIKKKNEKQPKSSALGGCNSIGYYSGIKNFRDKDHTDK